MNIFFKKSIIGLFFVSSAFICTTIFAQTLEVENVAINLTTKTLSANITGTQAGREIDVKLWNPSTEVSINIASFPWQSGNISASLQDYSLTTTSITAFGQSYSQILIEPYGDTQQVGNFQIFLTIADITSGGEIELNPEPEVTVNFPGWDIAQFEQIGNTGQYYPYVKTNGVLSRTPSSAPLYLVLENTSSSQKTVLHMWQGGTQSLNITWPETPPNESQLVAGTSYAVYLSALANGALPVAYGNSMNTRVTIGTVPGELNLEEENPADGGEDEEATPTVPINGGSTSYTPLQEEILGSGVVAQNCGYKIGIGGGGRICGFNDLILLVNRIIEYIFILVLPILALVFAYAGYTYITSGGNSTKRTAAKNAIFKALIGVVVILAAWLIVKTIVSTLGVDSEVSRFLG